MAEEKQMTTVQIDLETNRKLMLVSKAYERSKTAQLRWWVNKEYAELERLKLLPVDPADDERRLIQE